VESPEFQNLFDWDISTDRGAVVLTLRGEIDISVATPLAAAFDRGLADATTSLIADFADVQYIDSSGLKILVNTWRTCEQTGVPFRLVNLRPLVKRVIDIAGLLDMLCHDGASSPPSER
jgi:anti-sigma B factor antagonist